MKVDVRHGNIEQALRILKRKVQKEGIIRIAREKEFYEKPTAKRQRIKKQNIGLTIEYKKFTFNY